MATTPTGQGPQPRITPALFTKREKYAIGFLSIAFIGLSAATHFGLGAVGERMIPHFTQEATPPPQVVKLETIIKPPPTPTPTPKPTPTPQPTPTPPPQKNTPPPIKINSMKTHSTGGTGPAEQAYSPPPRGSEQGVPTAGPVATSAPTAAPPTAAPVSTYHPELVVDAQFRNKVQPDYPEIAKQQNIQGTCVLLVTIGPSGEVIKVVVSQSSGSPLLDNAAIKAVRASSFVPPTFDGHPGTETYKVIYTFTLEG